MPSFSKAIALLTQGLAELKALEASYDSPAMNAFVKAMGAGGTKTKRVANASAVGGVARYPSDDIKKVLDAVAAYVKEKAPSVLAFQKHFSISQPVAKSLVQAGQFPGTPRTKTVTDIANKLGVTGITPVAPGAAASEGEHQIQIHGLEKPAAKKGKSKAAKK
jgi:hypothetical protein